MADHLPGHQGRLQHPAIDLLQDIPRRPAPADPLQPAAQHGGARQRLEPRQPGECLLPVEMAHVLQALRPLAGRQHEGLEDRAVAMAPAAARSRHQLVDGLPESQPPGERRGHHEACPGSEIVAAFRD